MTRDNKALGDRNAFADHGEGPGRRSGGTYEIDEFVSIARKRASPELSDEDLVDLWERGLLLIQARAAARQSSTELMLKFLHIAVDTLPAELRESAALAHKNHRPDGPTPTRYYRFTDRPSTSVTNTSPGGHQRPRAGATFRKPPIDVPRAPTRGSPGLHRGGFLPAPRPHVPRIM